MQAEPERVLSVFELTNSLKRRLEDLTTGQWVAGEVGALKRPPSGHIYFSLKDESRDACLDCVMYRREAMRHARHLAEGSRVQLRGRASIYTPRGRFQWICDAARPAGKGALLEAIARLREKLIEEGLTASERKRPLPQDPVVIGVVTSATGAAFSDICTIARRRGRVKILLCPAVVQGDQAPLSIVSALDRIEQVADLDVLIVGRGGGAQEDLMAFNDERVVRRVASCRVPVVSAVGHEIDLSLSDLVADARAATPSEAAELVVPDSEERALALSRLCRHLAQGMRVVLSGHQLKLDRARHLLADPRFVLAEHEQALDELNLRMERAMGRRLAEQKQLSQKLRGRLEARHPRLVVEKAKGRLAPLVYRLRTSSQQSLAWRRARLTEVAHALHALSPLAILGRGYALATDASGGALRDASHLSLGQPVVVKLHRGRFVAEVTKVCETVETAATFAHESAHGGAPHGAKPGKDES